MSNPYDLQSCRVWQGQMMLENVMNMIHVEEKIEPVKRPSNEKYTRFSESELLETIHKKDDTMEDVVEENTYRYPIVLHHRIRPYVSLIDFKENEEIEIKGEDLKDKGKTRKIEITIRNDRRTLYIKHFWLIQSMKIKDIHINPFDGIVSIYTESEDLPCIYISLKTKQILIKDLLVDKTFDITEMNTYEMRLM